MPNIRGSLKYYYGIADNSTYNGALSGSGNSYPYRVNCYNDSRSRYAQLDFNASLSNTMYKDNHKEVTPYNFNVNLLVKI